MIEKKLKVKYRNFELEIVPQNYYKREIKKPYFEFDYFFFDAILREKDENGVPLGEKYLEIEYTGKNLERLCGFITINEIIANPSSTYLTLENVVTDFLLDYESLQSRYKFDKEVANKLGISNENFSISILLNELYEEIENKHIEELNRPTQSKFLYEPFFFKAGESILVSPMGEGKTLWVLSMLYRLQNNIPLILHQKDRLFSVINKFYIEPCNVVYFGFEGNITEVLEKKEEIKNWIKMEAELVGVENVKDFYIQFLTGDITKKINRKTIRRVLSVFNPKFVVIDSVTSAFLSFSSVDKTHLIYSFIRETFISKGIGVMLIMHPSKQDLRDEANLPRGTIHHLAIPRVVWGLKQIRQVKNGFVVEIKSVKDNLGLKRFSYEFEILFVEEEENNEKRCEIRLLQINDEKAKIKKVEELILEYIEEKGRDVITPKEIAEYYDLDGKYVSKVLNEMVGKEILVKIEKGKFKKKKDIENIDSFENGEITDDDDKIPF